MYGKLSAKSSCKQTALNDHKLVANEKPETILQDAFRLQFPSRSFLQWGIEERVAILQGALF